MFRKQSSFKIIISQKLKSLIWLGVPMVDNTVFSPAALSGWGWVHPGLDVSQAGGPQHVQLLHCFLDHAPEKFCFPWKLEEFLNGCYYQRLLPKNELFFSSNLVFSSLFEFWSNILFYIILFTVLVPFQQSNISQVNCLFFFHLDRFSVAMILCPSLKW